MTAVPFYDLGTFVDLERDEIHAALDAVIDSGYFVGGPATAAFEQEFAGYLGSAHCVGLANGLDALRLTLEAYGVGPGDEVIVPAFTFYATWLAVTQLGATPVPVDVDPATANLDPERVAEAITPATKAVIVVHLFGRAARMTALMAIVRPRGLLVIEDSAQSHGATSDAGMTGTVGQVGAFSFYPTKNLGALGDAGAIVTDDAGVAARIRSLRSYGQGTTKYDHVDVGWNSRLDPLQAAVLSVHLRKLDHLTARRREIAARYLAALGDRATSALGSGDTTGAVWHHFVIRARDRDAFRAHLEGTGVASDVHYPYWFGDLAPMRERTGTDLDPARFPASAMLASAVTSLPIAPWLSDAQVDAVATALSSIPPGLLADD